MSVKLVEDENNNQKTLKGVKCEYIISCGYGQYSKKIITVVFKNGGTPLFWVTGDRTKSLSAFKEGQTYDIACIQYNDSRYISNVRPIQKGE